MSEAKIVFQPKAGFKMDVECLDAAGSVVPLTGCTARGGAYARHTDATPVVAFAVTIPTPANGVIHIEVDKTESKKANTHKILFWDVLLEWPGQAAFPVRVAEGVFDVDPGGTE